MAGSMDPDTQVKAAQSNRLFRRPMFVAGAVVAMLLIGLITLFVQHRMADATPVPADVRSEVNFPVYYPRQSKLPAGYSLDNTSFHLAQPGVVVFAVRTGSQQLVFSEEEAPGGNIIEKFTTSYIPLHNTISTTFGKAAIGAAGQGAHLQTIVSLPIAKGPWLIITAPTGTKQSDMQQILQSLTQ